MVYVSGRLMLLLLSRQRCVEGGLFGPSPQLTVYVSGRLLLTNGDTSTFFLGWNTSYYPAAYSAFLSHLLVKYLMSEFVGWNLRHRAPKQQRTDLYLGEASVDRPDKIP